MHWGCAEQLGTVIPKGETEEQPWVELFDRGGSSQKHCFLAGSFKP